MKYEDMNIEELEAREKDLKAEYFDIDERKAEIKEEINIIKRHMWPLTLCPPRYLEGFIVTFVDKYLATYECIAYFKKKKSRK